MKKLFILICTTLISGQSMANSSLNIEGTVTVGPKIQKTLGNNGVLFIFAKKLGVRRGPPISVLRIQRPKFPHKFSLGPNNIMIPGTKFKGPFTLSARFTINGNALSKKGSFEGFTIKKGGIKAGDKNIKLIINKEYL